MQLRATYAKIYTLEKLWMVLLKGGITSETYAI